jgi:uncharacterized protein (TIGR02246 family)
VNRTRSRSKGKTARDELEESRRSFITAMKRSDPVALAAHYTPDAILVPQKSEIIRGRASIQPFLRRWLSSTKVREFEVATEDLRVLGDAAYAVGTYRMACDDAGSGTVRDEGKFLIVYERSPDGKWQIVRDISSSSRP